MLTRRNLLTGATLALAAPAFARLPTRARVITLFDRSGSTSTNNVRVPNLTAWADVMDEKMPGILETSGFDEIIFEAVEWASVTTSASDIFPLIDPIVLKSGACTAECGYIASLLRLAAKNNLMNGDTDIIPPLEYGLSRCLPDVARNVINFVTDDDTTRNRPSALLKDIRAKALSRNITINGMVMGDPDAMAGYVDKEIKTGPSAWVLKTVDFPTIEEAWNAKFHLDIA